MEDILLLWHFQRGIGTKDASLMIFLLDLYRGFERQVLEIRTHGAEDLIKDMVDCSSTGNIMFPADKGVDDYIAILKSNAHFNEPHIFKNNK